MKLRMLGSCKEIVIINSALWEYSGANRVSENIALISTGKNINYPLFKTI